jgi:large subunit ribosomal protein L5
MTETATRARLKTRYLEEIRPALIERFGYSSPMQAPKLEKITLNMGVGLAKQDSKMLKAAQDQLATIAGQQPSVRRARKSIAAFKLREGMPVGVAVTLRAERGYEFLDRLVSIAIPRIRDFRGLSPRSFDGRGNYTLGVKEQIIFPEIDYDGIDQVRGLDITITTSAKTDVEAFALLEAFGMPFATQGRPKEFGGAGGQDEGDQAAPPTAEQAPPQPVEDEPAAPGEETTAETEVDAEADADTGAGAEVDTEADTVADAGAETDASAETGGEVEADTTAETEAKTEPDAGVETETDAVAEQTDAPEAEESADTAEKESTD